MTQYFRKLIDSRRQYTDTDQFIYKLNVEICDIEPIIYRYDSMVEYIVNHSQLTPPLWVRRRSDIGGVACNYVSGVYAGDIFINTKQFKVMVNETIL